jgi:hypothetical protein
MYVIKPYTGYAAIGGIKFLAKMTLIFGAAIAIWAAVFAAFIL